MLESNNMSIPSLNSTGFLILSLAFLAFKVYFINIFFCLQVRLLSNKTQEIYFKRFSVNWEPTFFNSIYNLRIINFLKFDLKNCFFLLKHV